MDAFWSALADFLAKMEHQKASGRANLTKLDVKKNRSKKTSKNEGLVLVTVAALVGPG